MAKLSDIGIPGVGVGILHPKLRHRFTVSIETAREELVEAYNVIEQQLVSFDIGTENLGVPMISHAKGSVVVWLQDDAACKLMTALRQIQQAMDPFHMTLSLVDANEAVVEQYTFGECRPSAMQHSVLSYESTADRITMTGSGAELRGTIQASTARDCMMKLLQIEFNHYGHKIIAPITP